MLQQALDEPDGLPQLEDVNFNMTLTLINSCLYNELVSNLKVEGNNNICLRSATLKKFVDQMFINHNNIFENKQDLVKEMFILSQTCKGLYYYNDNYFNLTHQEFRAKILYPNIIYILIRYLHKASGFLRNIIKNVYYEIQKKAFALIKKFESSYYLDEDVIKTEILYEFLGNLLRKFNPMTIDNMQSFYKQVFRNIFSFYFRSQQKFSTSFASMWGIDLELSQMMITSARLTLYRDVLYENQVKRFCRNSKMMSQINYNFTVFKNVIISNEFQNMYFAQTTDTFMLSNDQYKLLKIYDKSEKDDFLKKLKDLPLIFKLLKCVHIINPKIKPYNEMLIKPEIVKNAVLEELLHPFRNMFSQDDAFQIFERIAQNFTDNILSGEYINLLTLSNVRINHVSFINQLKKFVVLCIEGVSNSGRENC